MSFKGLFGNGNGWEHIFFPKKNPGNGIFGFTLMAYFGGGTKLCHMKHCKYINHNITVNSQMDQQYDFRSGAYRPAVTVLTRAKTGWLM